MTGIIEKRWLK